MTLWMEVSTDKYELPLAVADTARELAELRGYKGKNHIYHEIWRARIEHKPQRFLKVEVENGSVDGDNNGQI